MVYESDFYTTRRPYSRPTVSSYSVTSPIRIIPGIGRVHTYSTYPIRITRSIPFVAHKRIVTTSRVLTSPSRVYSSPTRVLTSPVRIFSSPVRTIYSPVRAIRSPLRVVTSPFRVITSPIRTLPSVLHREYQRIENRIRPRSAYTATEDYLNSASARQFDDETRDIRVNSTALLRHINSRSIRAESVSRPNFIARYEPVLKSRAHQDYYHHFYPSSIDKDFDSLTSYNESRRNYMGPSHLASMRIVGNKGYPKRASNYDDIYHSKVRNDVNLLSYYLKNRNAASNKTDLMESVIDTNAIEANETPASG